MNLIQVVLDKLIEEGFNPTVETFLYPIGETKNIVWTDPAGSQYKISTDTNIAIEEDKIAWFQSDGEANHLLKIYQKDSLFSWIPKTHNPIFGCYSLLLEWYEGHLIFIYQEKHGIYISSIRDQEVKQFYFHGEEIERNGHLIAYENYTGKLIDKVRVLKLPELLDLEPIDRREAEKAGLIPRDLNRPGNFLSKDFVKSSE